MFSAKNGGIVFGGETIDLMRAQDEGNNGFDKKARGECSVFGKMKRRAEKVIGVAKNEGVNKM